MRQRGEKRQTLRKRGNKSTANSEQEECLLPPLPWPCWPSSPEASPRHLPMNYPTPGHSDWLFPVLLQQSLTLSCPVEGKVCGSRDGSPPGLSVPACFLKGLILHSIDSFCFIVLGLLRKRSHLLQGKVWVCVFVVSRCEQFKAALKKHGGGRETSVLAGVPFHTAGTDAHLGRQVSPGTDCSKARQGMNGLKDCASQYGK